MPYSGLPWSAADQPYGWPKLDANGHLVGPLIPRSGLASDANLLADVGEAGEFIRFTDTGELFPSDGVNPNQTLRGHTPVIQSWQAASSINVLTLDEPVMIASGVFELLAGAVYRFGGSVKHSTFMDGANLWLGLTVQGAGNYQAGAMGVVARSEPPKIVGGAFDASGTVFILGPAVDQVQLILPTVVVAGVTQTLDITLWQVGTPTTFNACVLSSLNLSFERIG